MLLIREAVSIRLERHTIRIPGLGKFGDCWETDLYLDPDGYPRIRANGTVEQAHRVAYALANGLSLSAIKGRVVRHKKCDNTRCVRPDHLELGSVADNNNDTKEKGRHFHGDRLGISKLTEEQVIEIHKVASLIPATSIARLAGVSSVLVGRILKGKKWSHLYKQEEAT